MSSSASNAQAGPSRLPTNPMITGSEGSPTSMTDTLLEPLNTLQKLSHTLFLSLSPAQNKPPQPPPIEAFIEADANLAIALQQARIHQVNQRKIVALTAEVLELENRLRDIWMELEKGKRELEETIEEGDERVKAIEKAKDGTYPDYFCQRTLAEVSKLLYHTPSYSHTLKVLVHSLPHHLTCPT